MIKKKVKFQALGRAVIVKEIPNEIEIGNFNFDTKDDKNAKFLKGEVISITPDSPKDKDGNQFVNNGDKIMYDAYKSTAIIIEGEVYSMIYVGDIVIKL
jgi:co-chaperonin GroES (HSP10)